MPYRNDIKLCSKCKEEKNTSEFNRRRNGYRSHCKQCLKDKYFKRSRSISPVVPNEKLCGTCGEVKAKDIFHSNKYSTDGLSAICKPCKKEYDNTNKERFSDRKESCNSNSPEYRKKWNTENAELKNGYTKKRREMIKKATPSFADKKSIIDFYKNTPDGMEVDHIIPIQCDTVCGLHIETNLQYLSKSDNMKKGVNYHG